MSFIMKTHHVLEEKMYVSVLPRGIKCYIIPKYGLKRSQGIVSFSYGSSDNHFMIGNQQYSMPLGTAHFLEHKMFENIDGNYFMKFAENSANVNAFTDFQKTAYYFESNTRFYENLKTLTKMVQSIHVTEENVKKEKGIIDSEITMYEDDPSWQAYYNMLKQMYQVHPIRYGIAGSSKSIGAITPDVLRMAHCAFYTPETMSVVVCGDVDVERVLEAVQSNLNKEFLNRKKARRAVYREPKRIGGNFIQAKMGLSVPMFYVGFKMQEQQRSLKQVYGMKMLLDLLTGESSSLFGRLQGIGYMEESLSAQYIWGRGAAVAVVMGQSREPKVVANAIVKEIEGMKERGICNETFNRIKKKHLGRFIRGFNSVEAICMAQTELSGMDTDLFEAFDVIRHMEADDLNHLVLQFNPQRAVLSIIR